MERRSFILSSMVATVAAVLPKFAFASGANAQSGAAIYTDAEIFKKLAAIGESTADCLKKGKACEAHCKKQIAAGDKDFEKCYSSVRAMMILCDATGKLAALKSTQIRGILDACIASLETCRDACLEHKEHFAHGMHLQCKECEESCEHCIDHCKDLKAALSV